MTTLTTTVPAIRIDGVSKTYGATKALQDVSVSILPGQVHGLIGRNGAGKSTLLRMITGLETPDTGTVSFFGEAAPPASDPKAWQQRVACVYQRPSVFANLTIAENLFAGRLPTTGARVSWTKMQSEAERILDAWNIRLDPKLLLADAPIEERQMLTIAKALEAGTRIVLLDEPTVQLEGAAIGGCSIRCRNCRRPASPSSSSPTSSGRSPRSAIRRPSCATANCSGRAWVTRSAPTTSSTRSSPARSSVGTPRRERRPGPRRTTRRAAARRHGSRGGVHGRQPLGRPGRADRHRRRGGSGKYSRSARPSRDSGPSAAERSSSPGSPSARET